MKKTNGKTYPLIFQVYNKMVRVIKQADDEILVNDKLVYRDSDGVWTCTEELTTSETKSFREYLKSLRHEH